MHLAQRVHQDWRVCVVMPARNEAAHILQATTSLPEWIDRIIVVDDGSTDETASLVKNVEVISTDGIGVGGAIAAGYQHLVKSEGKQRWCAVVMAGDGQMNPSDLPTLLAQIINGEADFVKGDRGAHEDGLSAMPIRRRMGTWWLKHLTNMATGLSIHDPQCGYTVCNDRMLKKWDFSNNWNGYGYPNWWLLQCMEYDIKIKEAPVKAVYEGQSSGIKIFTFLPVVSWMLLKGLFSRGSRWYLLGQSKATLTQRATISIGFLGGCALLFSIPLIGPMGLCGIFGLGVARKVDATLLRQLETTQVDPRA